MPSQSEPILKIHRLHNSQAKREASGSVALCFYSTFNGRLISHHLFPLLNLLHSLIKTTPDYCFLWSKMSWVLEPDYFPLFCSLTCWLSYPLLPANRRLYDSTADFRKAVLLPDQTFLPCLLNSQVALCCCLSLLYSFCWLLLNPVKFLSNFNLNFKRNVNFSKKKKVIKICINFCCELCQLGNIFGAWNTLEMCSSVLLVAIFSREINNLGLDMCEESLGNVNLSIIHFATWRNWTSMRIS